MRPREASVKRYPALPVLFPAASVVAANTLGPKLFDKASLPGLLGVSLNELVNLRLGNFNGFHVEQVQVKTPL